MTLTFGWWDHFERLPDVALAQQYRDRIALVQLAESLGFARYHVAEHHFSDLDLAPSPLIYLSAMAQHTTTIRLCTLVLCLPLYHPTRLLQEICMVDQLSQGRLEVGVGRGVRDADHIWLSSDPLRTRARFEETLRVVSQGLLTGRLDHSGEHYAYDGVPVRFTTVQQPLPFWYVGNAQYAGTNGMYFMGSGLRADIDAYLAAYGSAKAAGDPRFGQAEPRAGSTRHIYIAATDAEAREVARRAWRAYGDHFWSTSLAKEGVARGREDLKGYGGDDADEYMAKGTLVAGSVESVTAHLLRVLEAGGPGYNHLVNAFQWGDISHAEARASLTLFGGKIMPTLRQAHAAASRPALGSQPQSFATPSRFP